MALVETTLASAMAIGDGKAVVASATGVAIGYFLRVDQELMQVAKAYVSGSTTVPVLRAQDGTAATTHPSAARTIVGAAADWATPSPQTTTTYPIAGKARTMQSYSASGAIALPVGGSDHVAVLNGTGALTMTLATPTLGMDGTILTIVGNGAAAHTVAPGAALNNAGSNFDTNITFAAGGMQLVQLMAMNEFWVIIPSVAAGTLTNVTVTYS